jgi:predicted dehydrogenase
MGDDVGRTSYRVGVIGLSAITTQPIQPATHEILGHAQPQSHLAALSAIDGVEVVAGCDIVPEACARFTETWGGTWPDAKAYTDYREMLANHELDVVCVATPDHLHGEIVREVAASGVKGIFCEKPISTNLADVDAMIESIERHRVVVNVNHTRRWMPPHVAAREAIRGGAIGTLSQVTIHFGGLRAMLWRNHAHFIDIAAWYAESDPVWVMAELESGFDDYGTAYKGNGGADPSLEPGVNAYIAYANGVRAFIGGWKSVTRQVNVDLYGSEGRIHTNDQLGLIQTIEGGLGTTPIVPRASIGGMQAALEDLLVGIETGREVQSPPREARKTVAVIEAILASQASGNVRVPVKLG